MPAVLSAADPDETAPTPRKPAAESPPAPRLSWLEKAGLAAVLVAALATAVWFLSVFHSQIPTRSGSKAEIQFPVAGQLASIADATTFWRVPIREGSMAESVRLEAQLIPVLKLRLASGRQGALRIFFRNASGDPVGDSITRTFADGNFTPQGQAEIEIAATAGFDDEGMHAAYRADKNQPWHVEIFEGPASNAPFQQFNKLLRIPISSQRR
jgi:hypothetical protein